MRSPWHTPQDRPASPRHSEHGMMRALPGGETASTMAPTSLDCVVVPGCIAAVSGLSFSVSCVLKNLGGGWDQRLGRLDDGVALPFGDDVPGFVEVHFVRLFGGYPQ